MRYDVNLEKFDDGAGRAHMVRYYFARGFVEPRDVVNDAACGTGYGSKMLSEVAAEVNAFDQLEYIKYQEPNYYQVDLEKSYDFPISDVSVSLETIEHLNNPDKFISSILQSTSRFFIFSVPLGEEPGANPFHMQTFNLNSAWETVMRPGWKQYHSLMQGNHLLGVMWRER